MALYEHVYLARQDASAAQVETLTEQFKSALADNGGSVSKTEYWGIKPLNHRIRKNRKAHFSLLNIEAPAAAVAEMERQMKISEDVIRFMTIRVDEHEEDQSVMLRFRSHRGDRNDRPRRRFDGGDRADSPRRGSASDDGARAQAVKEE